MKFIKPLNEELEKITIESKRMGDLNLEMTGKFLYIQQDNGNIVQQIVIEKEQAKKLITILQNFSI